MFIERPLPVVSAAAGNVMPLFLAKASTSFLLAIVSEVTETASNRLAAISCQITVVSFNAARARFLSDAPMQLMVGAAVRITVWAQPRG